MENKYKLIPYGISDFKKIQTEGYYYVDKTNFIPKMEDLANYVMYLRPRRFGKSLFTNVLSAYYDVLRKDEFDAIFGGLYIHEHPTSKRNSYLVLKFNFSAIDTAEARVEDSFNWDVKQNLKRFTNRYRDYLPEDTLDKLEQCTECHKALKVVRDAAEEAGQHIYLIIDEYDNFANTLFSYNESAYRNLTHGDGFFRLFFNIIKEATTDNDSVIDRIFITGVTPLTLSDVTSGYNIGMNLSLKPQFNHMIGLTESEVRTMLEYYRDATGVFKHSVDEIIEHIKPWYNRYCFSEESLNADRVFNTDMVLYFVSEYTNNNGKYPRFMVDANINTDYGKIRKLVKLDKSFGRKAEIIQKINLDGEVPAVIVPEFSIDRLGSNDSLVSLLLYMGFLSIERAQGPRLILSIPNYTVKQQFFNYMQELYSNALDWRSDIDILNDLGATAVFDGNIEPLFRYIAETMQSSTVVRDYDKYGEAFVKGFALCSIGARNNYYIVNTEQAMGKGYADMFLEPINGVEHAYVIELKYLKHSSTDKEVEAIAAEAKTQLQSYITTHNIAKRSADNGWHLHGAVVVFRGWDLAFLEQK